MVPSTVKVGAVPGAHWRMAILSCPTMLAFKRGAVSVNLVSNEYKKYILGSFFHRDIFSSRNLLFLVSTMPYDCGPYNRGLWFNLGFGMAKNFLDAYIGFRIVGKDQTV